jgi:hypothetical protein
MTYHKVFINDLELIEMAAQVQAYACAPYSNLLLRPKRAILEWSCHV